MTTRGCILLNPVAGRGTAANQVDAVRKSFSAIGFTELVQTASAGHEERLTWAALNRGCRTIVVVGGDGTCGRVATAILESGRDCCLAVVPLGTGNDFSKTLGLRDFNLTQIVRLVASGHSSRMDVGRADGHYFLNSCGFGFAASVLEATNRVTFLKGDAIYIYSALAQLVTYRGIEVSLDSATSEAMQRMLMITVSNGRYLGGAFQIAPQASVLDGELDVSLFGNSNVIERVRLFAGALKGTHTALPSVTTLKTREMVLHFSAPPAMEIDGELRHATSSTVRIECAPQALSVVAAPGALA